ALFAHFSIEPAASVQAAALAGKRESPVAEAAPHEILFEAREISDSADAAIVQSFLGHLAHSRDFAHFERREKIRLCTGNHPQNSVRLRLIRCHFRNES